MPDIHELFWAISASSFERTTIRYENVSSNREMHVRVPIARVHVCLQSAKRPVICSSPPGEGNSRLIGRGGVKAARYERGNPLQGVIVAGRIISSIYGPTKNWSRRRGLPRSRFALAECSKAPVSRDPGSPIPRAVGRLCEPNERS